VSGETPRWSSISKMGEAFSSRGSTGRRRLDRRVRPKAVCVKSTSSTIQNRGSKFVSLDRHGLIQSIMRGNCGLQGCIHFCPEFYPLLLSSRDGSLLRVSPACISCPAILITLVSHRLRQFPHRPVSGQRGLRIRFFRFPCDGLNHYQPPHATYSELSAQTATKC